MGYCSLGSSSVLQVNVFSSGQIMEFSDGASNTIFALKKKKKKGKFVQPLLLRKASWSECCIPERQQ